MKPGFTIIELLFALVFSAMIAGSLFVTFFQTQRISLFAQNIIDYDTRIALINNQLQKDLSGVFVPLQAHEQPKKQEAKKEEPKQEKDKKSETAAPVKKEEIKPLKDVFLGVNKGELLSELTFITNNPVHIYEYAENALVKPSMVRVFYHLVSDKKNKNALVLIRQEGTDLDSTHYTLGDAQSVRGYELADNIKSITVQYTVPLIKPEKEQAKDKKEEKPFEYETVKEWRFGETKDSTKKRPKIPFYVTMTIAIWDDKQERERTYTFQYPIASFAAELDRMLTPTKAPEQPKKEMVSPRGIPSARIPVLTPEELKAEVMNMQARINGGKKA